MSLGLKRMLAPLVSRLPPAVPSGRGHVEPLWIRATAIPQDWWYGIDTRAALGGSEQQGHDDAAPYEPLRYAAAHRILREIALGHDDVFFDVGCGRGRILCLVARHRLKRCVGIEYSSGLAASALANSRRVRGLKTTVEVRVQDAAFADYSDATIVFFYNPFGPERMERCLKRIGESWFAHPRALRIIYANPVAEQAFNSCGSWLRRVRTFRVPYRRPGNPSIVAVWESR